MLFFQAWLFISWIWLLNNHNGLTISYPEWRTQIESKPKNLNGFTPSGGYVLASMRVSECADTKILPEEVRANYILIPDWSVMITRTCEWWRGESTDLERIRKVERAATNGWRSYVIYDSHTGVFGDEKMGACCYPFWSRQRNIFNFLGTMVGYLEILSLGC